jgi:hypothetical protein
MPSTAAGWPSERSFEQLGKTAVTLHFQGLSCRQTLNRLSDPLRN